MFQFDIEKLREKAQQAEFLSRAIYFSQIKLREGADFTTARLVEEWAEKTPNSLAILSDDGQLTYRRFNYRANQLARALRRLGAQAGESVALIMDSRPEYLVSIVGASKLGLVTGLINTNLTGDALLHALKITEAKWIIAGSEQLDAALEVHEAAGIPKERFLVMPDGEGADVRGLIDLEALMYGEDGTNLSLSEAYEMNRPFVYICTSGTTGLPKAAMVRNRRFLQACYYFGQSVLKVRQSDVMYTAGLPLYHNTGISQAWGVVLTGGGAVALRRKFSASRFFDDCDRFDVTMFTYVGEICRYLVKSKPHPLERKHRIRMILGAGLRPDIWVEFRDRFAIPQIFEYYGATEGNVGLINFTGKVGMVGRISPERGHVLAKVDPETEEMVQEDGKLVAAKPGESGILLAKIGRMAEFEGYVDKSKNASKVLDDPFGDGARYFNTGDLLTLHADNWVSFADRLGDTFRWKGENVSTNDVQEQVSRAPGVLEAVAYGVEIPGADGRAGMVAIRVDERFDPAKLREHIDATLPFYARPLFVRVEETLPMTGSYKYVKTGFKADGFDPAKIAGPKYFYDAEKGYVELTAELAEQIKSGKLRL